MTTIGRFWVTAEVSGAAAAFAITSSNLPREAMQAVHRALSNIESTELFLLGRREETAQRTARRAVSAILSATAVGIVLVVLACVLIHRAISIALEDFERFVTRVGQGDLRQRSSVDSEDEFGNLAARLNQMIDGLKDLASQTRAVTEQVNASTACILASAGQQATSTAEQAAAIQQMNATMQELGQSGVQISERAKEVAAVAQASSKAGLTGMQAVESTNATMQLVREQAEALADHVVALSERTQAVGEIITTVNDIAEQSHLLSLNAAIQAAAAGEHGRSFGVIASEIKNLAGRSKEATVQVRSLLGEIHKGITSSVMLTEEAVKRVEFGKSQAAAAQHTMRDLTGSIEQSVEAFQQIVAGTHQQQIAFEQVILAIRNISQASDQTALSVRQFEAAAANLTGVGRQLRSAVEQYQI